MQTKLNNICGQTVTAAPESNSYQNSLPAATRMNMVHEEQDTEDFNPAQTLMSCKRYFLRLIKNAILCLKKKFTKSAILKIGS